MASVAKWTFMVYMGGDNRLSDAAEKDLAEMRSIGSTDEVSIVAQVERLGDACETKRFLVLRDGRGEYAEIQGETDSGDPRVLRDFLQWTKANYPAERYALVAWNCGAVWEPSELDTIALEAGVRDYGPREAMERVASPLGKALLRPTVKTILSLEAVAERAICSDNASTFALDTLEFGRILHEATRVFGQPLDLLGLDAFLSSNLELAYQLREDVRYMVASEDENVPFDGWPYDAVLGMLVDRPGIATADFAAHIVDAYFESYRDGSYNLTLAALALRRLEQLVDPLDGLAEALIARMPDAAMELWAAQRRSASFYYKSLWDIAHFCQALETTSAHDHVRRAAEAVRAALQPGSKGFVSAEAHRGAKVERCGGVSIYLPPLVQVSRFYEELDYARDHRWLPMLEGYHTTR